MSEPHWQGDPAELAALYSSGAMTEDQVAAFEQHVAGGCVLCRAELSAQGAAVRALWTCVEPVSSSDHARDQILSAAMSAAAPRPPRIVTAGDDGVRAEPSPQVWKQWTADVDAGMCIRRADGAAWEQTGIAGIEVRRLFMDPAHDRMTCLVRMAAGTAYPRHIHAGPEECLVLQGELRVGDEVLHAGDYQRAAPGSHHPVQSTDAGCVLLIVSSLSDELED